MRSIARTAHLVVALALIVGLGVQIYLAGLGVFKGGDSFSTHQDFGYILELLPLILLILGLVARLRRRQTLLAAGILGLFLLQSVFIKLWASNPEVAALHPLNGFLITVLAIVLARTAWLERRAGAGAAEPTCAA